MTINYRLSSPADAATTSLLEHRFPLPIHDTLTAYDFITNTILPELCAKDDVLPDVQLAGSHIGGALAASLALTEYESISSVDIVDPIVDWCMLDEHAGSLPPAHGKSKRALPPIDWPAVAEAARALLNARTKLFPTPSTYFDPFASPMLFLRTPGRDTPRTHVEALGLISSLSEDDILALDEIDSTDHESENCPAADLTYGPYDDDHHSTSPSPSASRRYKVLRLWPPNGLRPEISPLPEFHIYSTQPTNQQDGLQWLLQKQAADFHTYLQRACFGRIERDTALRRVKLYKQVSVSSA